MLSYKIEILKKNKFKSELRDEYFEKEVVVFFFLRIIS